ncbi:MAG: ABC transporter permease [Gemmatimonadetes bacterium]|uniref:ABC transporter permease n=1 Tax=Candidatus Kutchimonas denitrificans TaxID=3056748 RepID=A0AAE5CBU1_9BACT|nr:ABC transporter permease [Gemmatimonadota bacterium]NIR74973.1 ABC transporter permease [Candidatus Kutchimonas denitrificans]NIS01556.1 ABC transporter permease [Gemmatimonadota bacterium]NIT67294.1 ABC transporter permease [Gemmatimonadota bacterium]NIU52657.1 FtsX-like permease family protein [Gemmatimonadota bacterium]
MNIRGLQEGIEIALHALRQSKIRTGLTILGVAIGVVVVVAMASVIQGINASFDEVVEAAGPNTYYVTKSYGVEFSTGLEEEDPAWQRRPALQKWYAREIERAATIENAYASADLSWLTMTLKAGNNETRASILAVPPDFMQTDPGDIVAGRFYTQPEEDAGAPIAVIDSATAYDLFAPLDAVGRSFRIGNHAFTVVGVYKAPPNLFASLGGNRVFVPYNTGKKYLLRNVRWISFEDLIWITVVAEPAVRLARSIDEIIGRLRAIRGLEPDEGNNFDVVTQDRMNELWNQLTVALFTVMFALSSVGLMVGGIGVIAVMVVSVTERTREIGVRKALGATRRDILWQFLVEAATLTTLGGAIGLAVGAAISWGVDTFTPVPASIPLWSVFAALLAAGLTGIVFGLFPAVRASRMDPVRALRYE